MEQVIKMALYEMAIVQPTVAKMAQTFLEEQKIDTVAKLRESVINGTLTESTDAEHYSISRMIDVLLSTEQTCQFS